jgi:general secretion pathway protein J
MTHPPARRAPGLAATRHRSARGRAPGFTLVEVLVAIFIVSLMAAMAWQGIDGMVRAREGSQQRLETLLRLQTVLAQWEQDLGQLQETGAVPALAFDGATVRLTRRQPEGMQLVAWSLRGGAWLRHAANPVTSQRELQDDWLRSQQLLGNEPGQLRTLAGVTQWQLFCFRGNAWSNCQSDDDVVAVAGGSAPPAPNPPGAPNPPTGTNPPTGGGAPPPTATRQVLLPTGVRLVLVFAEGSGLDGRLTRDTLLGPQSPP